MKKKLLAVCMCLLMVVCIFAGCNLFERDTRAYLDQTVAESGDVNITMEELVNGYYQYGQYLVSQYGLSQEDALKYTIDWLINREYMMNYLEEKAAIELADETLDEKNYRYALTSVEYNDLVRQVWGYVDDSIEDIIEDLEGDKNIFKEEEDTREKGTTKTVFEPTVKYENGHVVLADRENVDTEERLDKYAYQQKEYKASVDTVAWQKYIANLKKSEKGKGLSTVDSEVFHREIDRMFKIVYENKMIENFEDSYSLYYGFDDNGVMTDATIDEILERYMISFNKSYEKYTVSKDKFYTDMISTSDRSSVYYYADEDEFYEVSHILIKFSEDQTNEVARVKDDPNLTPEERTAEIDIIKSKDNTKVFKRDNDGYETEEEYSVTQLETYINGIVTDLRGQYSDDEVYAQKVAEAFDELVYQFNGDPGIMNKDFDYVVGKNHSGMIDAFTTECRRLGELGEGSVSDSAIMGDSGYHIIIVNRKVKNVVQDAEDMTIELLSKTYTSRASGKSYLELIKADLVKSDFSSYQTMLISTLKDGAKTVYYTNRYKDLYSK